MPDEARPTVLVVEDERSLADIYVTWLEDEFEVRTAYNGNEALDLLDDDVDVVLLDRRMPVLSGDAVLDEIDRRGLDCRVALVTAVQPDVDIVDLRFDDYLLKPVAEEDLRDLVERLLNRAEYDRQMQEFFALVSKKATLETTAPSTVRSSDEYAVLEDLVTEVKSEVDASLETMDTDDVTAVLRDIDPAEVAGSDSVQSES